jgi:hypothetical protein
MLPYKQSQKTFQPILLVALAFLLGLSACNPADLPDTGGVDIPDDLPPQVVQEAIDRLSQELGVTVEEIEIVEFEQVEWPDACLGVPQEGQACAQVITPGFRVVLEVNGQQYEFHSDQEGAHILRVPTGEAAPQ